MSESFLVTISQLEVWLHDEDLSQADKLLLILASFDGPRQPKEIVARASEAGLKEASKWNITAQLARTKGRAISVPKKGWKITQKGYQYLQTLGLLKDATNNISVDATTPADPSTTYVTTSVTSFPLYATSPVTPFPLDSMNLTAGKAAREAADDLKPMLETITDETANAILEEAIECCKRQLFRSAIVMLWMAAIYVLRRRVLAKYPTTFDAKAKEKRRAWQHADEVDDFHLITDADFLDLLYSTRIISKGVKDELDARLKTRNSCGHLDSIKIGPQMVVTYVEALSLNVFERFPIADDAK